MRLVAATFYLLSILFLVFIAGYSLAQEKETKIQLEEKISALEKEAKFSEALESATELLALVKEESDSKPFELKDTELLITTLTYISSLSESAQQELAMAWRLQDSIDSLQSQGKYNASADSAMKQLELLKHHLGDEHVDVAQSMSDLGLIRCEQGDYDGAVSLFREVLAMRQKLLGKEHPKVAESIGHIGAYHIYKEDYAEAERFMREALEMKRKLLGNEDLGVAETLNNLALILTRQKKSIEAEPLQREAIAIKEKHLGNKDPEVLRTRSNLGSLLKDKGDLDAAEAIHRDVLEIRREILGNKHPDTATSLNELALVLSKKHDFAGAAALDTEALEIRREVLGREHPLTVLSMQNLASVLNKQGDWSGSERLNREILAIQRKTLGDEHPNVARTLNDLASMLHVQGNYAEAEVMIRESLAMSRRVLGDKHSQVALGMQNLGILLTYQGDYAESEAYLREALALRRELQGENHPQTASTIGSLARALEGLGKLDEAESLHREALAMRRELLGDTHLDVAKSLNNLAANLAKKHEYEEAAELMSEALDMFRQFYGDKHPYVARCISNLGVILYNTNNDSEGEACLHEGLAIKREFLSNVHPDIITSLMNLGMYSFYDENYEEADSFLVEAAESFDAARLRAGRGISRAGFLESRSPYPLLAATQLNMEKMDNAWPPMERSLGQALSDILIAAQKRSLTQEELEKEDKLRSTLSNAERELTFLHIGAQRDSTSETAAKIEAARRRLLTAQSEWSSFQKKIAQKYPLSEGQAFPLERIQKVLASDEAILGWLDVDRKGWDEIESWIYVIRNKGQVKWFPVDSVANGSGKHQKAFRSELEWPTQKISEEVNKVIHAIAQERILPAMSALEDVTDIMVIPSGPMMGIPVEALTDGEDRFLVDRFVISYTPSATIHTWLQEQSQNKASDEPQKILLVGDPPFCEAHQKAMTTKHTSQDLAGADPMDVSVVRSVLSGNERAVSSLPRLPASRAEIEAISSMSSQPTVLVGTDASEQNLRNMTETGELGEFDVIHIATHALVDVDNPKRSALVLSQVGLPDAFEAVAKGEPLYSGMVTITDIVREWDLQADLVTLSACETGLGKKAGGEGYIGFMHAFLQAGARSLLVSLWKVDDRATSLLMQRFYENYLGKRERAMTKAGALQEAKNWLRTYKDDSGQLPYAHPAYWSGFILVGDRD